MKQSPVSTSLQYLCICSLLFLAVGCENESTGSTAKLEGLWAYISLGNKRNSPDYIYISASESALLYTYQGNNEENSRNCYTVVSDKLYELEGPGTDNQYTIYSEIYTVETVGSSLLFNVLRVPINTTNDFQLDPVEGLTIADIIECD